MPGRFSISGMPRVRAAVDRLRATAEWRFLAVLPRADRGLAAAWWTLVLVRGLLPVAFTVSVGLLVGAARSGSPLGPLIATGLVFIAMNALSPLHEAIAADLGEVTGAWFHDRLMRASLGPPGLAHLER